MILNIFLITILVIIYLFFVSYIVTGLFTGNDSCLDIAGYLICGLLFGIILGPMALAIDIRDKLWQV